MSQPLPLPVQKPEPELDLLSPLAPKALLRVGLCALIGGLLGFGAGKWVLHHAEARAVIRVGSLGLLGPAMPLSEVKARAESHGATLADLKSLGVADLRHAIRAYRFDVDVDDAQLAGVVKLDVSGPDEKVVLALTQHRVAELIAATHQAYAQAQQQAQEKLADADAADAALHKQAAAPEATRAAAFERWADELTAARRDTRRELAFSRDSEVIDPPYLVESNARALLMAALGCFAGILLGLALTLRPARAG